MHVGIVMGSDSDLPVMKKAAEVLSGFGVTYDMAIASAHRTPKKLEEFILAQEEKGAACFIAGAGMAAALPGVVASMTLRPVIGVPLSGARLDGMDALFSIVQMPSGIPVATVAIDGAKMRRTCQWKSARQQIEIFIENIKNTVKKWLLKFIVKMKSYRTN